MKHMNAHVDRGQASPSSVHRQGARNPIGRSRIFFNPADYLGFTVSDGYKLYSLVLTVPIAPPLTNRKNFSHPLEVPTETGGELMLLWYFVNQQSAIFRVFPPLTPT